MWRMDKQNIFWQWNSGAMGSKAEEIGDFDEYLAAIIHKSIGNVEEVAVGILTETGVEVLQV